MRYLLCVALFLAIMVVSPVSAAPVTAPDAPLSSTLRISQVYGGGGNTGATYKNDFIELFNSGSSAVSLAGWSVQYASAAGSSWSVTNLSGSIAAGGYYLIQETAGTGGTVDLPTPDATGTIAVNATAGKVALVNSTTAFTVACPTTGVIDFVGYGTANCYEGTGGAPAPSNTTADLRGGSGCMDTGQNSSDFTAGAPNPRNSNSVAVTCVADLSITKTVSPVILAPGAAITYTLSFSNTGAYPATAVTLADSIPVSVTISGVTSSTVSSGVLITGPDFAWTVSDLAVGAGGVITLTGTVNPNAALIGTLITNTATITASNDLTPTNNNSSAGVVIPCPTGSLLYVNHNASGGSGLSWANAFRTVQDALAVAAACPSFTEIWVAVGVYTPTVSITGRSASFQLVSGVGLYGGFATTETLRTQRNWQTNITVLSGDIDGNDTVDAYGVVTTTANIVGNNAYHVVTGGGTNNTASLDGFTISGGNANDNYPGNVGGGMYNLRGSPTLTNVTFSGNSAYQRRRDVQQATATRR